MQRTTCRNCAIRDKALCRALPEQTLGHLNQIARRRRIRAGSPLFEEAAQPTQVANIISGVVRLSKSLPDGRTQIVGLQFPGDFVGRPFAREGGVLAEASTDLEVCYFSQSQYESLILSSQSMQELFAQRIIAQLDEARDWMLLLGRKTAEERVASFILMCSQKLAVAGDCGDEPPPPATTLTLPLSRKEMADVLGIRLETVGRMMKRLEQAGIIKHHGNRGLEILNHAALLVRSENEQA